MHVIDTEVPFQNDINMRMTRKHHITWCVGSRIEFSYPLQIKLIRYTVKTGKFER